MLMREIAGELNITKEALATEHNVVLAEAHVGDVPATHLRKSDFQFLYGDRPASALLPIGSEKIIENVTPELVRGFYEAWYRPERATLIVVGDIDPAEIEARIKARFSDWKPLAPPRPVPAYHAPATHPAKVKLFVEPGAQTIIALDWLQPFDATPDSVAEERREVIRFIALGVVNQRLSTLAHGANPPFLAAAASHDHVGNFADATELALNYRAGEGLGGLKAIERVWRDAVKNGRAPGRGRPVYLRAARLLPDARGRRRHHADRQCDRRSVAPRWTKTPSYTSPQYDLAHYEEIVKGLTAAEVSAVAAFRRSPATGPFCSPAALARCPTAKPR